MRKKREKLYKAGDTVRIKEKFYDIRFSYDPGIADVMKDYEGTTQTINCGYLEIHNNTVAYDLDDNGKDNAWMYTWAEEWLELVESEKNIKLEESELMNMF